MPVLKPLSQSKFNKFFGTDSLKVIQYFMNVSIFAQPEVHKGKDTLPIQIPKEHLEQWFVQALKVESVGAGSYPIDVLKPNEWGADVKMLSCKIDDDNNLTDDDTGETSLAQKFTGAGVNLDDLFSKKKYQDIIDLWIPIWKSKMLSVIKDKKISKIYYFFFLRGNTDESYLCAFEVDYGNIDTSTITQRDTDDKINKSVFLNGVIDKKYGNAKIYKAKKRLELRLKPKSLYDDGFLIPIKTKLPFKADLYNIVKNKSTYDQYLEDKFNTLLNYSNL